MKEDCQRLEKRSNFPHAMGALDGKHIRIWNQACAGSLYNNYYKGYFSIVLMALVDADYRFIWVEETILDVTIDFPAPEPMNE
jgi:hypothetical protein